MKRKTIHTVTICFSPDTVRVQAAIKNSHISDFIESVRNANSRFLFFIDTEKRGYLINKAQIQHITISPEVRS